MNDFLDRSFRETCNTRYSKYTTKNKTHEGRQMGSKQHAHLKHQALALMQSKEATSWPLQGGLEPGEECGLHESNTDVFTPHPPHVGSKKKRIRRIVKGPTGRGMRKVACFTPTYKIQDYHTRSKIFAASARRTVQTLAAFGHHRACQMSQH